MQDGSTPRFRALPLAIALAVLGLSFLSGRRITLDNDIARLLPDSDAALVQGTRALRSFLERTIVDVGSEDGSHSLALLGEAADRLAAELEASGTVLRARADLDLAEALELVELVRARAPLYLDERAWSELEARLEPEAVQAAVAELERRIQEPDGALLAQEAPRDPLGLAGLALASLGSLAAGPPGARLVDGRLVSADGRHLLVLVEPGFPASELERSAEFLAAFERIEQRLAEAPAYRGVRLRQVGAHRSTLDNARQVQRDVKVTTLAGTALIALLSFVCFGHLRLVLLSLSPALVGGIVALGVFALFHGSVAAPVLGFGSVLIGLTIDFAVHVLTGLRSGHRPTLHAKRALFLGAISASLAFAILRFSALPGMRDLGTFGSLGVLAAMVYALWVLPSLGPLLGDLRPPILDLERLVQRPPRPRALWIALLATPLLVAGALRIEFDGDVRNLSRLGPETAADEEAVHATWGVAQVSSAMIEAPSLEAALAANDALARALDGAVRDGLALGHASIAGLLPSLATQAERVRRWQSFWTPERRERVRADLAAAAGRTRFRSDAFAPFLASLDEAPERLELADLEQGPGAGLVADRLTREGDTWRIVTPVYTRDWEQFARLEQRLRAAQPGIVLANREALMRGVAGLVSRELVLLGGLAFAMVAGVVFLWLADARMTAVVLLPLVVGLSWTLGILGWLGVKLDLVNAVFVVMQFGVTIDYSIFITSAHLERRRSGLDRVAEARGSVLLCAVTTCVGFGSMMLARHPVLSTIGSAACLGIACATLAAQILVPVLCGWILERPPGARRDGRWWRPIAERYRYHGPFLKHYTASKAKRDPLVRALPELCAGRGPLLVVGSGYGVMTARLALAAPEREIVALEPDRRKLEVAESALGAGMRVRFLAEDVRAHVGGPYEWVLLVDVLHYWPPEAQREILSRVRERMSDGARLLFRDGCREDGAGNALVHAGEALARLTGFTRMPGALHFHPEDEWRRMLAQCGFRVESTRPELGLLSNRVLVCSRAALP